MMPGNHPLELRAVEIIIAEILREAPAFDRPPYAYGVTVRIPPMRSTASRISSTDSREKTNFSCDIKTPREGRVG